MLCCLLLCSRLGRRGTLRGPCCSFLLCSVLSAWIYVLAASLAASFFASAVAASLPVFVVLSFCVASPTPLRFVSFSKARRITAPTVQRCRLAIRWKKGSRKNRRRQALPCPPTPLHATRALCTGSPEKGAELSAAFAALARFPPPTFSTSPSPRAFSCKHWATGSSAHKRLGLLAEAQEHRGFQQREVDVANYRLPAAGHGLVMVSAAPAQSSREAAI